MAKLNVIIFIFGAILFFVNAQVNDTINEDSITRCGYVYDGDELSFDLDYQISRSTLSANWFGFETLINSPIKYEWCIVSEGYLSNELITGPAKARCRTTAGFEKDPDILNWTDVGLNTKTSANNLKLEFGKTYFIVLRLHMKLGSVVYTNSDGITIIEDSNSEENIPVLSTSETSETSEAILTVENVSIAEQTETSIDQTFLQNGRDLETQKWINCFRGVGHYLTELYGPPVFVRDPTVDHNVASLLTFASDSESGMTDAQIAGTIVACVVFSLLLLLLLPALKSSKKTNKFQTNPHRTENIENI